MWRRIMWRREGMSSLRMKINLSRYVLVAFLAILTLNSYAKIYYVSNTGVPTDNQIICTDLDAVNNLELQPGDQVLFKRGDVWTGSISVRTSGTAGNPIVYGSYGSGAKPIIKGTSEVTDWTLHSGNTYKANVAKEVNQLIVDGEKIETARYPNYSASYEDAYLFIDDKKSSTVFSCDELVGTDWTGATAILRLVGWSFEARKIIACNAATGTITLESAPNYAYAMEEEDPFFIVNHHSTIDESSEWAQDIASNTIYLQDENGELINGKVECSVEDYGISGSYVNYITVSGLEIRCFKKDAINFSGLCSNIIVDDNKLIDNYGCGVNLYGSESTNNITITNNTVVGSNRNGILTTGVNLNISFNTIKEIGLIEDIGIDGTGYHQHSATGILAYPTQNSTIANNSVKKMGYIGIMFMGRNNTIEKNRVDYACLTLNDGGGIYCHMDCTGSTIKSNLISNVGPVNGWYDSGIYMDATTNGVTIEKNTVFNNWGNGIFLSTCKNTTTKENVCFNNKGIYGCQLLIRHITPGYTMENNSINNNTLFTKEYGCYPIKYWANDEVTVLASEVNANVLGSPELDKVVFYTLPPEYLQLSKEAFFSKTGLAGNSTTPTISNYDNAELFYNDSNNEKSVDLSDGTYQDLEGNVVSSLTLQPFTSKILVKTGPKDNSNQKPVIQGQIFEIQNDIQSNELVAQVLASDPDVDQTLSYVITQGNEEMFFYIDPSSGKLYLNRVFDFTEESKSFELEIEVTDNGTEPLSASAIIVVNVSAVETPTEPGVSTSEDIFICEGDSYNGWTEAGEYERVLQTASGGDSTVTTNLYVNSVYNITEEVTINDGEDYNNWTESGEYVRTLSTVSGCDSIVTTVLTVIPAANQTPVFPDYVFDIQGSIQPDGLVGHALATDPDMDQTLNYEIIQGNGAVYFYIDPTTGRIYLNRVFEFSEDKSMELVVEVTDNGENPESETATVTINITFPVVPPTPDVTAPMISSFSIPSTFANIEVPVISFIASDNIGISGYILTETSITPGVNDERWSSSTPTKYTFDGPGEKKLYAWVKDGAGNISGSQSAEVTISLQSVTFTEDVSICEGESYQGWTVAGQYERVLESESGADSIVITNLIVNRVYNTTEEITINEGENYIGWTESGVYERTLASSLGCDSIVSTNLTVLPVTNTVEDVYICEGESYGGWTSAGQYERVLTSSFGGDSIITTNLYVNPVYNITEDITIKEGESYNSWTESGVYERTFASSFGCDSVVTTNLSVIIESPNHFNPIWDGTNGYNHMSLNVISATQYDTILEVGDEIAVFDGEVCVGAAKLEMPVDPNNSESYLQIKVSQDDGSGNGFTPGDQIVFLIWDKSDGVERSVNQIVYKDDLESWETSGTFIANATSVVELAVIEELVETNQIINLKKGWNIFSGYVNPHNPEMDVIQQQLIDNGSLVKVQDEAGNTFEKWNTKVGWINNIGDLYQSEGYKIRVKSDCELELTGYQVVLPYDILLSSGYNIISFPVNIEANALDVLQPLIDSGNLIKVQDEKGNAIEYWDNINEWVNNIGNFKAGEGYIVKVVSDDVLPILKSYPKSSSLLSLVDPEFFEPAFVGNGSNHMNINVIDLEETELEVGDELAAFDGEICVGAVKLMSRHFTDGFVSINASSTDVDLENGFTSGNAIKLKVWQEASNKVFDQAPENVSGELVFNKEASVFVELSNIMDESDLKSIDVDMFPNPTQDKVTLRFSELPINGARVMIMDLNGKQLLSREILSTNEVFDIQSYPSGIYLMKIIASGTYRVEKVIKK